MPWSTGIKDWPIGWRNACCVYALWWDGRAYIGSTKNLYLRSDWTREAPRHALLEILEECSEDQLRAREQMWLVKLYNQLHNSRTQSGNGGYIPEAHTPEAQRKRSDSLKKAWARGEFANRKPWSEEARARRSVMMKEVWKRKKLNAN